MELTLNEALQKGIEAHKAGKAQEADQYYTTILKAITRANFHSLREESKVFLSFGEIDCRPN